MHAAAGKVLRPTGAAWPAVLQVCVPQLMALVLTYPERVTEHNIEKLKQRVLNGGWQERGPDRAQLRRLTRQPA